MDSKYGIYFIKPVTYSLGSLLKLDLWTDEASVDHKKSFNTIPWILKVPFANMLKSITLSPVDITIMAPQC